MANPENSKSMSVTLQFAMSYVPKIRKKQILNRPQHTFLYIVEGEYLYRTDNKESFTAMSGETLYIPKDASYSYEIISETVYAHQIEFEINDPSFTYVSRPMKIIVPETAEEIFKTVVTLFGSKNHKKYYAALASLYTLCSYIPEKEEAVSDAKEKIRPAVKYIEAHCTEKIELQKLADMCFMSKSQLGRYFKSQYNTTPISYKNRFRIEKSKQMLLYDVLDTAQIAEKMGFDSVYSFSKIFKQYVGLTPTEFSKNKNKG
jgi:AraC-like DNA-binding protein